MKNMNTHYFDHHALARLMKGRYTQTALAEELGVSFQAVHNYVHGKKAPKEKRLQELCAILCCDVSELKKPHKGR